MNDAGSRGADGLHDASAPAIELPKGGGAIAGMGERVGSDPLTGTASLTVPIAVSAGRGAPPLSLSYGSGSGNGPFGLGWSVSVPRIMRKTENGLPRYDDAADSDVFLLTGSDDLTRVPADDPSDADAAHTVARYQPRIEGTFSRIERWTEIATGTAHWRVTDKENRTCVLGRSAAARVADPDDPSRVFAWLCEETSDDRGNVTAFEYKPEDRVSVDDTALEERNRAGMLQAQRYLKRIRYGNAAPFDRSAYLFEIVFDYGEHDDAVPAPDEARPWPVRADAFSTYRAGFEIRTSRLCRRVLVFHTIPELDPRPTLVKSTTFVYDDDRALTSLRSVVQRGHVREGAGYRSAALPALDLVYTVSAFDGTVRALDPESAHNLPVGVDGSAYRWVDLDGDALSGVLTEQAGTWFYKRNFGGGRFGPMHVVAERPATAALASPRQRFADLEGDGGLALVELADPLSGFYERGEDGTWRAFASFAALPSIDWDDPNLRFVDLDGDGRADVLVARDTVFTWYPARGREGYGAPVALARTTDEERGPALVFDDGEESIYLAGMTGGLRDLVRIRNGDIAYWPNLGFGRFGAKVTMRDAPVFDSDESFDRRRIRLADVDGTGMTDVLYVGPSRVTWWRNLAGNAWSAAHVIGPAPAYDSLTAVDVADVLGTGTSCLVWSAPERGGMPSLRYVELTGGVKPYLLASVTNNRGATVSVDYAPSTAFCSADRSAGTPWVTKLPFVVHVVAAITTADAVSNASYTSRYAYHHGFYDPLEREFRGFGMVEQRDTDAIGAGADETTLPPVVTKTWYHLGAFAARTALERRYAADAYAGDPLAAVLPGPALPPGLDAGTEREALRALKGQWLRREIYAEDGTPPSAHPYTVSVRAVDVALVRARGANAHPVFLPVERESVVWTYEREPGDPRVVHSLNLAVDPFGTVTRSATVAYPRRTPQIDEQAHPLVTSDERDVVNHTGPDYHRWGVDVEKRSLEIGGVTPASTHFRVDELRSAIDGAVPIGLEIVANPAQAHKRLLARERVAYWRDDLGGRLPAGTIASRALVYERYRLALTPELATARYGARWNAALLTGEGGYLAIDGAFWVPTGRVVYDATAFYQQSGFVDPFGATTSAQFDPHQLAFARITDPIGNVTTARLQYRMLKPWLLADANGNRSGVRFDPLGFVAASAVLGKTDGEADALDLLASETSPADSPTTTLAYDLGGWSAGRPDSVRTTTRERFGDRSAVRESYEYTDGLGHAALTKVQADPGDAPARGADGALLRAGDGTLTFAHADQRWIGTGRTIRDNKGNAVRTYEPFFDSTPAYDDDDALRLWGVASTTRYDPLGRAVRTDQPDGTLTRVVFDPWSRATFDPNDTVLESAWFAQRAALPANDPGRRAADAAVPHANTPAVVKLDVLGREVRSVENAGGGALFETRSVLDAQGNRVRTIDARGIVTRTAEVDYLGRTARTSGPDTGERCVLEGATSRTLRTWDARGHVFRWTYDAVSRPTHAFVAAQDGTETLLDRIVYGESVAAPEAANLRTRVFRHYDGAGSLENERFDVQGNLVASTRRFVRAAGTPDWSPLAAAADPAAVAAAAEALLAAETFAAAAAFDALRRTTAATTPDGSVTTYAYGPSGKLNRIDVALRGGAARTFVSAIVYDAQGRRTSLALGNGAVTAYAYDPLTSRLTGLRTVRAAAPSVVQDLGYAYDPVGNVIQIDDAAQPTVFFANAAVTPQRTFAYDPLYRLTGATGREHVAQAANPLSDTYDWTDGMRTHLPQPGDGQAMRAYAETYAYDAVGNVTSVRHAAGPNGSWTRNYAYAATSNRLTSSSLGADGANPPFSATYGYDAHGNTVRMQHLAALGWNARDQLESADLSGGGSAAYAYDADGRRVRKSVAHGGLADELFSAGAYEITRRRNGGITEERHVLHVVDGTRRIAMVETKTIDRGIAVAAPADLARYQLEDHLRSAAVELDGSGALITYEEYYAFGATSYQAGPSATGYSLKRFRYTGVERDDETGLSYHFARYYAPWLARWISCDPAGLADGVDPYAYARNNPVRLIDSSGLQGTPPDDQADPPPDPLPAVPHVTLPQLFSPGNFPWANPTSSLGRMPLDALDFDFTLGGSLALGVIDPSNHTNTGGGLNVLQFSGRRQMFIPGMDFGLAVGGNYLSQGGAAASNWQNSMWITPSLHYSTEPSDETGFGYAHYLSLTGGFRQGSGVSANSPGIFGLSTTGVFGWEKDNADWNFDVNYTASWFLVNSFSTGPMFSNPITVGGQGSVQRNFANQEWTVLAEIYGYYEHGFSFTPTGDVAGPSVDGVRFGGGAGFAHNWFDRDPLGHMVKTNTVGVNVDYGHEALWMSAYGTNPASTVHTNSLFLNLTSGFRGL